MRLLLVISIFFTSLVNINSPQIHFESKTCLMDTLISGKQYSGAFKFYNTGDESLIIERSLAAAGNVVSTHPLDPIAPGDSGEIKFSMTTRGRVGPFTTTIAVINNAEKERTTLVIKGYIKKNDEE